MTSMVGIFLTSYLGKSGVVYGFIIALCMEVLNLVMMTKVAKKAEDMVKQRFGKIIDGYKERERAFEESDASSKRSNEALEKQLQVYIDNVNALEKQIREKENQVAQYRETIARQEKIIAAATKPVWD
jgi:septal ring factor EnvC (AmiA/AmiB activator)